MTVAALLDLGADQKVLLDGLKSLKVDGYRIEIGRVLKSSIDACDFNVILEQDIDHDHEHSHGDGMLHTHEHNHEHSHEHIHNHAESHIHDHSHSHEPKVMQAHIHEHSHEPNHDNHDSPLHLGHHEHRNLYDINTIIEDSDITENAKLLSKKIFHIIATAEAKAHSKPLEEVHFHEVGAIDSIVDIVAAAVCLDNLNIKKVIVSELYEGTGQIKCQHGLLPIPVPAVINIATEHQLPLHITSVKGELVTPTGAAIVAAIKTGDNLPPEMKVLKVGLGAGKRNYDGAAGILRAMLIEETTEQTSTDKVWVLEANIDDCNGEALAFTMELLFQNGAKDVYYTPIFMKKNRPAYLLGVICKDEDLKKLEGIIFLNTTTIGIRKHEAIRSILPREQKTISTVYGDAQVKICSYDNQLFIYPEFESIKLLCQTSGQDYMTMYQYVQNEARKCI
jgi:TIGR00299 family protein